MSANVEVLGGSEFVGSSAQGRPLQQVEVLRETSGWNPEDFAREQIRGLVRRVFFASGPRAVRQVVFSATEAHTDVASICDQVARGSGA